ncbi:50S ribosomal protein L10 [Candidatus Saccharibacteria bacterium]|jgi:large subunit ribosomal protein L10|nr:50S ribosomal protein L10 [Candidatus Saccharibacteria bacterium]
MALSKEQKEKVVTETTQLLESSKMTVLAQYSGIPVKSMQVLRKTARDNQTVVRVIKNRLVLQALNKVDKLKNVDKSVFKNQLLYAFNSQDEVAAAQALNNFAKTEPSLKFIGAISGDGAVLSVDDVKALANLPSKEALRAQLAGTVAAPLSGFVNVLNANLRGFLNILDARAKQI